MKDLQKTIEKRKESLKEIAQAIAQLDAQRKKLVETALKFQGGIEELEAMKNGDKTK